MANDILPKDDLHILHVRNILGYPSTDLGTLCGGVAACAARINMWAKYKPVRNNFTTDRPSNWWQGSARNCGIHVPTATSRFEDMLSMKYTYEPPRGGSNEPFRLGDFRNYYHNAKPQYSVEFPDKIYNREINHIRIRETGLNDLSLKLSDIFAYETSELYLIARMIQSKHTYASIYATTQEPFTSTGLGNQTISFYFDKSYSNWFTSGSCDVIIGICNFRLDWDDSAGEFPLGALFFPMPFRNQDEIHRVIECTDASTKLPYRIEVVGGWNGGGIKYTSITFTQIKGSFTIVNNGDESRPFNTQNNYLRYKLVITFLDSGEIKTLDNQVFYAIDPNTNENLAPKQQKSYTFHIYTDNSGITRPYTFEFTILQLYDGVWRTVGKQEGVYNDY